MDGNTYYQYDATVEFASVNDTKTILEFAMRKREMHFLVGFSSVRPSVFLVFVIITKTLNSVLSY